MNNILIDNILAYLPSPIAIRISMMCYCNNVLWKEGKEEGKKERGREEGRKEGGNKDKPRDKAVFFVICQRTEHF